MGAPGAALRGRGGVSERLPDTRTLLSGLGTLESVIADDRGRLFFTDADAGQLLRMERTGAAQDSGDATST